MLTSLKWEICLEYLDNIIVFARDWAGHLARLRQVFQRIREARLKLQSMKCTLGQAKVAFLSHLVSQDGIKPDPKLLSAI